MFYSCEIYNPKEQSPCFVRIKSIRLADNPLINEGSLSNHITDAWIYVDNQYIGTYEMPVTFPVLQEGKHTLTVYGGIKLNGISATRAIYPFYAPKIFHSFYFEKGKTIDITDSTTIYYKSETASLSLNEDFESNGISFITTVLSNTSIQKTVDQNFVFEGRNSGMVVLPDSSSVFEIQTTRTFNFIKNNQPIFMELNYKSEIGFAFGYFYKTTIQDPHQQVLFISPSSSWTKLYINLTPFVNNDFNTNVFSFYIFAHQTGKNKTTLLLDNIKLLRF